MIAVRDDTFQKILKEFTLFFITALIGSILYITLELLVSNKIYSILTSSITVVILFTILVYYFFKKREKLLGIINIFQRFDDTPPTFEIIKDAQINVEFMGISARTFFESEEVEELMKKKIWEGVHFKFLVLDPSSKYLEIKAQDEGDDPEAWKHDIYGSIRRLNRIKRETKADKIEIKKYDFLPIWRTIFIDNKIGYITYYPPGHRGKHAPVFLVTHGKTGLYTPIHRTFLHYWEISAEVIQDE